MIRRIAVSFVLISFWGTDVCADGPLPSHLKRVDPRVRFQGIEDYTDYVFYLRYFNVHGNPHGTPATLVELKNSGVFSFEAGGIYHMAVLAIPRPEFDKRRSADSSLAWLKGGPLQGTRNESSWLNSVPEVQYVEFQSPPTLASVFVRESPLTEYRITLTDGRLDVEVLAICEPNFTPPLERWPVVVGGLFGVAALGGAGVWFARRRWRNGALSSAPNVE
jgi:hypothetical protein